MHRFGEAGPESSWSAANAGPTDAPLPHRAGRSSDSDGQAPGDSPQRRQSRSELPSSNFPRGSRRSAGIDSTSTVRIVGELGSSMGPSRSGSLPW